MKQTKLMTRVFLAAFVLLIGAKLTAQPQALTWAKTMGGNNSEGGADIAVDASGNVYTIGQFYGTADFDPGAGTCFFTNPNPLGEYDIYISKLDPSGNFVWAKQISARSAYTTAYNPSISIDANGDIVYSGIFRGTVDFDPGPATFNMVASTYFDIFICKISPAGNFIWAKQISGALSDIVSEIDTDASGNILAIGWFSDSTDFDPGPGTYKLGTPSMYNHAIFVCKLNTSGDLVWAKKMGGDDQQLGWGDIPRAVEVDASDNIYITGIYDGAEDFDPGAGTFMLNAPVIFHAFIVKLDASGNFTWAKECGGNVSNEYMRGNTIAINASGDVYYAGDFKGTFDFDPGPGTTILSPGSGEHTFIIKLDVSGNFIWAKAFTGVGDVEVRMTLNNAGDLYFTGTFYDTVDFDPGPAVYSFYAPSSRTYITKLDPSGNFTWANIFETGQSNGNAIELDAFECIYITGSAGPNVDFDPGPAVYNVPVSSLYSDAYVCKFSPANLGVQENGINNLLVYPNPANSILTIQNPSAEKTKLALYAIAGELINVFEMENSGTQIDVSSLANGMYFLIAETTQGKTIAKIQVAH
jgi:hypothetical protein